MNESENENQEIENQSSNSNDPFIFKFYWMFIIFHICMFLIAMYVFTECDKNIGNLISVVFFPYLYIPWFISMNKCKKKV